LDEEEANALKENWGADELALELSALNRAPGEVAGPQY
jgi:hypothetical protein